MDPVMRRDPSSKPSKPSKPIKPGKSGPPSPTSAPAPNRNSYSRVHPRDAAMKHDQSTKTYDNDRDRDRDRRDRDRFDRDRRVPAIDSHSRPSALRSLSPISRRPEGYGGRGRDTRDELFPDQGDRSRRPDVSQRGRSPGRGRNLDASREVKDRPPREERGDKFEQDKHRGIPTSPRHGPRNNDHGSIFFALVEKTAEKSKPGVSVNVTGAVEPKGRRGRQKISQKLQSRRDWIIRRRLLVGGRPPLATKILGLDTPTVATLSSCIDIVAAPLRRFMRPTLNDALCLAHVETHKSETAVARHYLHLGDPLFHVLSHPLVPLLPGHRLAHQKLAPTLDDHLLPSNPLDPIFHLDHLGSVRPGVLVKKANIART
ncbi:hypothetical protein AAE478_004231 [Parahypoxylon ruwenzoriense]